MQISPSVLNSDLASLADEVRRIQVAADWVHLDVMDNHFVPNMTFGLPVVESLLRRIDIPADCHLMIDDPDRWAPGFAEVGADSVTFHVEAARKPRMVAKDIRAAGARVGIAVKPGTPVAPVADLLPVIDMILVMTVEPGFGGQAFMAEMLPKVRQAAGWPIPPTSTSGSRSTEASGRTRSSSARRPARTCSSLARRSTGHPIQP